MSKKLGSISEIRTGYNFRSISGVDCQTVNLVSAKDFSTDFVDTDEISIPSSYSNYLQDGDILVKSRGLNYEAKVFIKSDPEASYIAANTLIIVRIKDKDFKPRYIAQIINSDGAQRFLRTLSSGQTVSILSPVSLGSLMCPEAPLDKQERLEIIAKTIEDYEITLVKYVKAQGRLMKVLQNNLTEGVR